jgi:galactofuranosylgalactofuranosylrhamnosyl-N-acetylglucosaminyl-diphospho-decaprenol beta-1,5/1,6-galactofuranosyltransferase
MTKPTTRAGVLVTATLGLVRQLTPVPPGSVDRPEREVPAADAGWWSLARLDSALVSTTDGTGVSWHRRDRARSLAAGRRAVQVHQQLLREWPRLAAEYRAALPDLVGVDAWRKTLDLPLPEHEDRA